MTADRKPENDAADEPLVAPASIAIALLAAAAGAAIALLVLPAWVPSLARSLAGPEPRAYWYLSRASGLVAYALLWLSMVAGLAMSTRWAKKWPGGPVAFEVHRHASLLGLAFAVLHAVVLLGDRYVDFDAVTLLVPFAAETPARGFVALGQIAMWGVVALVVTSIARRRIGHRAWRAIHFVSFTVYVLALAHGIGAGSEGDILWVRVAYWATAATVLFAAFARVLEPAAAPKRRAAAT